MPGVNNNSRPISLKNFAIGDSTFWKEKMELVRKEVIPYQWEILNDRVENAAPSFCMRNFKVAGKLMKEKKEQGENFTEPVFTFRGFESLPEDKNHLEDKFYGFVFQDSDFFKWIEAVAYSLMNHPDKELEEIGDKAIGIVCLAQQENGYLDTYYIINGMDKIFTNLRDHHELYCFGHLVEGAVAYYEATGKDKLLNAAIRFAGFIDNYFGREPEKCKGYPGHEIAEMALIRLYETTGDEKYLNLSRFFIEERGKEPYYFTEKEKHDTPTNLEYHQSHLPARKQEEATGHAVRAVYLYSGMADLARITKDKEMQEACKKLWRSITREKMYITGGIGSTHMGEAFSYPFDLPNDTAYAETCASIGLVFFARRMLEMDIKAEYADVMEQALYNTVLSGMSLDGKSFFYVNPLEVLPEACHKDERKFHVKPVRQNWFGCACCPPNLSRLVSSLPCYAYTENEDTIFMHLYLGGQLEKELDGKKAVFEILTDYPWEDKVSISYKGENSVHMKLAIRIPGWCPSWNITVNNEKQGTLDLEQGYYYIEKNWNKGDTVELQMKILPRVLVASPKVREDIGKAAIMKGPIVYCMEERDNSKDLHLYKLCPEMPITSSILKINGKDFPVLIAKGKKLEEQADTGDNRLYREYQPEKYKETDITLIPYYLWANRGENEMSVWIRV